MMNKFTFPWALNCARLLAALLLVASAGSLLLVGCGGGGGGGGGPRPTATAITPSNITVLVQLRDLAGDPVDGIVSFAGRRQATTGGSVSFANAPAGAQSVSAEVNGRSYSQNFNATAGLVTVQIVIDPALTPTPGGTPPAPPPL